jgi:hypothetical protein
MSQEAVQQVIGKAVMDAEFLALLTSDPEAALKDFDLTEDERTQLLHLNIEQMKTERKVDQRVTKVSKLHL